MIDSKIISRTIFITSGVLSILLYGYLILYKQILQPDLAHHIQLSHDMMDGKLKVAHPVFFILIQLLSGFSRIGGLEIFAGFLIFSVSQVFKISLSIKLIQQIFKIETSWLLFLLVLVCQLVISASHFTDHYVIGNISPNYFHNGTLSLSMPFVLMMVIETLRFIDDGEKKRVFRMIMLGLVVALIKPSFLFCWIPVLPFYVLFRNGLTRKLLGILQVAVVLTVAIIIQSTILKNPSVDFKVVFNPFVFFGTYLNHIQVIIGSLLFPIAMYVFCFKGFNSNKTSFLLFLMWVQATILSFCFYDTIKGLICANMTWQSSVIHYLLFVYAIGFVMVEIQKKNYFKVLVPLLLLSFQFFSGILYLRMAAMIRSFFI